MMRLKLPLIKIINPKFTINDLLKMMINEKSIQDILDHYNTDRSKMGNVFEKISDILFKLGYVSQFPSDMVYHLSGNINTGSLTILTDPSEYLNHNVFSKNEGGSSDITMKYKNQNRFIFVSSKFFANDRDKKITDYDVQTIMAVHKEYAHLYESCDIYLLVHDKNAVQEVFDSAQATNNFLKNNVTEIIDLADMERYFQIFKQNNIDLHNIDKHLCHERPLFQPRFHQQMFADLTITRIISGSRCILFAWKARSGKSLGTGLTFLKYNQQFGQCRAIVITPVPTATRHQFYEDFKHYRNFDDYTIIEIKNKTDLDTLKFRDTKQLIIVVSLQLLREHIEKEHLKLRFLADLNMDFIVLDEAHFHGTTLRSENVINYFTRANTVKLFLTATYRKPLDTWYIPPNCQFYWDLEDEKLCKQRDITTLMAKHSYGAFAETQIPTVDSLSAYDKMPELHIIVPTVNGLEDLLQRIRGTVYGYSAPALFSMGPNGLNYSAECDQLLRYISGSQKERDFPNGDKSCYRRIIECSLKHQSRTLLDNQHFTTQLWFLEFGHNLLIDKVSECLRDKMSVDPVYKHFGCMIINSKTGYSEKDLKTAISNAEIKAHADDKRGLIILAGTQASMGITLPLVDTVVLLNDTKSSDLIYQMMYRCMTETQSHGFKKEIQSSTMTKKFGYVIDANLSRILTVILNLVSHKSELTVPQKIEYVIENHLINVDIGLFSSKENQTKIVHLLTEVWKADSYDVLRNITKHLDSEPIFLDKEDQKILNRLFYPLPIDRATNVYQKFDDELDQQIPTGHTVKQLAPEDDVVPDDENEAVSNGEKEADNPPKEAIEEVVPITVSFTRDVLANVIPLSCLLTMTSARTDVEDILNQIATQPALLQAFDHQTNIWWNKTSLLDKIVPLVTKYIKKDSVVYSVTQNLKMTLIGLIDDPPKLLAFIESSLKPKKVETKKFGEVFTNLETIEMICNRLDAHYQQTHQSSIFSNPNLTWFDPANGIGNFPIAIYYKLTTGLQTVIPDPIKRKAHILEKMLFMAEINAKNSVICGQIFNHKINLYTGDSLTMDLKSAFGIDHFDVIIGNPPYTDELKLTGASPKYNTFIEYFAPRSNYLTMLIPSRWFAGGKNLEGFRQRMLQCKQLVYIQHFPNAKEIFKNAVDIKGGVNFFLLDQNYQGDCCYNGTKVDLSIMDIVIEPKFIPLVSKLNANFPDKITKLYCSQDYHKIQTPGSKDSRLSIEPKENHVVCYVSKARGLIQYFPRERLKTDISKWKVLVTDGAHQGASGFGNILIAQPDQVHCKTYISFEVDTQQQAESLVSYLKCKLSNLLLSLRKISQHTSFNTCQWIPLVPLNQMWTNELVYQYFQLSPDEMQLISDQKIVGVDKDN